MKYSIDTRYLKPIFETNSSYIEWYGYYNYDVIRDGRILCNRANFEGREISEDDTIDLGWYDLKTGKWHYIDTTDCFNWQQGAMLQWVPGQGNYDKVAYNKTIEGKYKSVIFDIKSGEKVYFELPIYCFTKDGKYALALNYYRLYWTVAYHYKTISNEKYNVRVALDDGIFRIEIASGHVERIVSIQDIIALEAADDFDQAKHWCEHIMLNPSSDRIAFLHRFSYGGRSRNTRICICDINGKDLKTISGWENRDWSHMGWIDDDSFVIYTIQRNALQASYIKQSNKQQDKPSLSIKAKRLIKNLLPKSITSKVRQTNKCYELYRCKNGKFVLDKEIKGEFFSIDGHPSFTKDGKYMITDSYPDDNGNQRVIIHNMESENTKIVGSFPAPLQGNPASCDLHPKLSNNGQCLVLDSAYTGSHRMIVFRIEWDNIFHDFS